MGLFDGFKRKKEQTAVQQVSPSVETASENVHEGAVEETTKEGMAVAQEPAPETALQGVKEITEEHETETAGNEANSQSEGETSEASHENPAHDAPETSASVQQGSAEEEDDEAGVSPREMPTPKATPIKSYAEKAPVTHAIGETKILAIINQKGGVGKSTTAINLGAALGLQNKAVLVVDLDPQGNTTSGLGVDKGQIKRDVYDVLLGELSAEEAIIPDVCPGLDLLPATINLAGAEVELVNEMARENRLKNALSALRGKYDYIFIDCPPALGLLTVNALVASDKLLIPIQCEFYALEGVTKLLDSMKRVKNALNPSLETFGVLLTMYDGRTMLARQVADEVRHFFGSKVFETIIPRTVRLSEAPSFGQAITEYDPKGKGALAYTELAKEVINRG